ncbi:MAG: hypothetical protein JO086_01565 [Acidimicrobiia bacterium]|nr:hypothetical protein [Acidimicrobiia bacterium]
MARKLFLAPAVAALLLLWATPAFANAANPNPGTTATSTKNPDRTTTVNISGTWSWPSQTGCSNRFGAGWAVAWSDPNQPGNIVSKNGITIYVGTPTDNTVHFNAADPCGALDSNNHPHGNFSDTHTYAAGVDPGPVCVNMYDLHDTQAKKPGDYVAGGNGHNPDNSVETNAYDPTVGGAFCVQPTAASTDLPLGAFGGVGLAVALGGGLVYTTRRKPKAA